MATPLPRRPATAPVVRRGPSRPLAYAVQCVLLVLVTGLLAGCGGDDKSELSKPTAGEVRAEQQALLDERARAVRGGDRAAFMAQIDRTDKAFVARQRRLFDNLQELPLQRFAYRVDADVWPADVLAPQWGKSATAPHVRTLMQLSGYDSVPTSAETSFVFARRDGRLMLVDDRTGAGKPFPDVTPPPWELTRIHARDTGGVLGVFDDDTWRDADTVMSVVQEGVEQVSRGLPFAWTGHVVTYAFSNRDVLDSFEGVPGGNIRHLGALTFPVYSAGDKAVGMRFTVLPSSVRAGQPFLGRIVRHELTHVALGDRDDRVPTWLTEGVAEYMGARDLPPSQRRIASVAVQRARDGATSMPESLGFNGADQDWHYALSWMACDYIADTRGEAVLWRLLDRLHAGGKGTSDDEQDPVLRAVLGYDSHQLARRAAQRILRIYQ